MAFHLEQHPAWDSGPGSQVKYRFNIDVYVDVVRVVNNVATISVVGSYSVDDYAYNTSNAQKASDFALIAPGDADAWDYQFTPGVEYYEAGLPCVPNAPQSIVDKVLIEFRGDTWRSDLSYPGNRVSLYRKGEGVILNNFYAQGQTRVFDINTTFDIALTEGGNTPILAYVSSGWTPGPLYEWLDHEVLVSWIDLDYIPGMIYDGNGNWLSHNRSGGVLRQFNGTTWSGDLKTINGSVGTGNPPSIYNGNAFVNQRRIGQE